MARKECVISRYSTRLKRILNLLCSHQDDGLPVSVFVFDSNQPPRRNLLPLAKNALRKLRTVRHPDVLKYIDTVDSDSTVYIMTERVKPLGQAIQAWSTKGAKEREDWTVWGLQRISVRTFIFPA